MLCISLSLQSSAEPAPIHNWTTVLPSTCYYATAGNDSIIAVTDRILILSPEGELVSRSEPLEILQQLDPGKYSFRYLSDNSLLLLQNRFQLYCIGLSGAIRWSWSLRDTLLGAQCYDLAQGADGTLYFCGTVDNQKALVGALSRDGVLRFCRVDPTFGTFFSMAITSGTLDLTCSRPSEYSASGLVAYDTDGNYLATLTGNCSGTMLLIGGERILSLGSLDAGSLFKRQFSAARDILLERFDPDGTRTDSIRFDFGKYETPLALQGQSDGFVMVTSSDESMNFGTNILNYFVTGVGWNLERKWQLAFGTDTSGLSGETDFRSFFAGADGTVLATHNDTLIKFTPPSATIRLSPDGATVTPPASRRWYDLRGRILPSGRTHRLGPAAGITVSSPGFVFRRW